MTNAAALKGVDAVEELTPPTASLARTIHQAKGESIGAVMVVARLDDATRWAEEAWVDKPPSETSENLRIAYVAFSRARRLLVLAIPEDTPQPTADKLLAVGFVNPPASSTP